MITPIPVRVEHSFFKAGEFAQRVYTLNFSTVLALPSQGDILSVPDHDLLPGQDLHSVEGKRVIVNHIVSKLLFWKTLSLLVALSRLWHQLLQTDSNTFTYFSVKVGKFSNQFSRYDIHNSKPKTKNVEPFPFLPWTNRITNHRK